MKEYIEREAALEAIYQAREDRTWSMDHIDVMDQEVEYVEKLPAADVEPVRHGEWLSPDFRDNDTKYTGTAVATCSVCGVRGKVRINRSEWGIWHIDNDYCPHCGAKMDGGK